MVRVGWFVFPRDRVKEVHYGLWQIWVLVRACLGFARVQTQTQWPCFIAPWTFVSVLGSLPFGERSFCIRDWVDFVRTPADHWFAGGGGILGGGRLDGRMATGRGPSVVPHGFDSVASELALLDSHCGMGGPSVFRFAVETRCVLRMAVCCEVWVTPPVDVWGSETSSPRL